MNKKCSDLKIMFVDYNSEDYLSNLKLRQKILRDPLGLSFTKEELENDSKMIHISVFDKNDKVVATAELNYLKDKYQLRQLAVDKDYQHFGVGSKILNFCEKYAKRVNIGTIICNARQEAVEFYAKHGFEVKGNYFLEHTIPHIKMEKRVV